MEIRTHLLRGNDETDFNAMVEYLKNEGCDWRKNSIKDFKWWRETIKGSAVLLLQGVKRIDGHFIEVTYLSRENRIRKEKGLDEIKMKDVRTIIPLEFYK